MRMIRFGPARSAGRSHVGTFDTQGHQAVSNRRSLIGYVLPLILLCVGLSGCVTVNKTPPATMPSTQPAGPTIERAMKIVAQKTTLGYIIATNDPQAAARRVITAAQLAKKDAADPGIDVSNLRHFVVQYIAPRFPEIEPLKLLAGADLFITTIEQLQGIDVNVQLIPADALPRTRQLVIAAADAAIEAAQPYAGSVGSGQ